MPSPDGWFTHAQGRETAVLLISVASAVQCVRSAETRTRSNTEWSRRALVHDRARLIRNVDMAVSCQLSRSVPSSSL